MRNADCGHVVTQVLRTVFVASLCLHAFAAVLLGMWIVWGH